MKFREIGRSVPIEVPTKADLIAHLRAQWAPWPDLDKYDAAYLDRHLKAEYSHEAPPTNAGQAGWGKVYIVVLKGYGAVGYSDAPLDDLNAPTSP